MVVCVNGIYLCYSNEFDDCDCEYICGIGIICLEEWLLVLCVICSVDELMVINWIKSGVVIIVGSGMCIGGCIVYYFKYNFWCLECYVVFFGFQVCGILGCNIVDGVSVVCVFYQCIVVKVQIYIFGGFFVYVG